VACARERLCEESEDVDGRWRLGGEEAVARELGIKLDYECATGRGHGAWTANTSLRLEITEPSEVGGVMEFGGTI